MRRIASSCWKSFSPNTATCGLTALNSFATTVVTPRKWPGREPPHRPCVTPVTVTSVWKPGGYIAAALGR